MYPGRRYMYALKNGIRLLSCSLRQFFNFEKFKGCFYVILFIKYLCMYLSVCVCAITAVIIPVRFIANLASRIFIQEERESFFVQDSIIE